ncbi:MAG: hypothetical protein JWO06_3640 [Bacteroidota bacterium]|nr:hypothetical protein [Bacteroidota bacterium]
MYFNAISNFIQKVISNITYLFTTDFNNFHTAFPKSYLAVFLLLRVMPVLSIPIVTAIYLKNPKGAFKNILTGPANTNMTSWILRSIAGFIDDCLRVLNSIDNKFLIIFIVAATLRIWYAITLPLIPLEGDAISRLAQAKTWFESPHGIPGGLVWLPVHHWIIGLPSWLGMDALYGGRFITLILGLLTFPVLYKLVSLRFNTGVALIACALLAVDPFHIKFSVITMSEVPFIFFVFAAFLNVFKYLESRKLVFLFLASLCVNCCNMIRFEGWIIAGLLPFLLLYYERNFYKFLLFGALNGLTIVAYMLISYSSTGHLIEGLVISDLTVKITYATNADPWGYIRRGLSTGFVLPIWMMFCTAVGVLFALKKRKEIPWLLIALFLLVLISWKVIRLTNEPFWRYFSTGLFLLLPFAAWVLFEAIERNKRIAFVIGIFAATFCYVQIRHEHDFAKSATNVIPGYQETASWIKGTLKTGEKYIYDAAPDYTAFALLSNTKMSDVYHPYPPEMKIYDFYEPFTASVVLHTIRIPGYKYIVVQRGLQADSILSLPQVRQEVAANGLLLVPAYSNPNFLIYSIRQKGEKKNSE